MPLFDLDDTELLISVYQKQGRTLDDLPYTDDFEQIYAAMYGPDGRDAGDGPATSRAAVFHRLHNLRKAGKLPKLGRHAASSTPPRLESEQEQRLIDEVSREVGTISKRDQLLYDPRFDDIVNRFNQATGLDLSPHDVWRVVSKIAKRSGGAK